MRATLDLRPFQYGSFRRLWVSGFVTNLGSQATALALAWQLKNLTHSALAVGSLGIVELLPLVLAGLYGGLLADHFDRKVIVVACEVTMLLTTMGLLLNAAQHRPMAWVIYLAAPLSMAAAALQGPSLSALEQEYVPSELYRASSALNIFLRSFVSLAGPAMGGVLVTSLGVSSVYLIDLATYAVSVVVLLGIVSTGRKGGDGAPSLEDLRFGARYARSRPDILGTYVVDLIAMIFAYPVLVLPFVADAYHFHAALPLLYTALPFGALLVSLTSSWSKRVRHYGRAVVYAATAWGLAIAVFGYVHQFVLAMVALVLAGAADAISGIFRGALWNETIPTDVRGRMAGIELLSYSVGPTLGQARGGWSIATWGLRGAIGGGGVVAAVLTGTTPLSMRALWRFRSNVTAD
jgi:MFS family permease